MWVLTTVADVTGPTVAEITAGTEITADLPAPLNFSGTTNYIDTSDISDRQDKNQVGTISLDNLDFEIYRDKTSQVAYDALANETDYYILKFEGGNIAAADPAAGDTCDVATVTVGIKSDVSSPRNDSRRVTVPAGIRAAIEWDATVAV
ncbi:MAG TPA: hypothetical protein VIG24_18370 [Acidimicrobiia bacterium]